MSFLIEILNTAVGTIAVSDGTNVMGVNADGSINVRVISGGGGGSNPSAGPTGSPVPADADYEGVNIGGTLTGVTGLALGATTKAPTVAIVDGSGNQIVSFGGGTQYADSAASGGAPTGTLAMGWDSANSKIRALKVDAGQNLDVAVNAALPAGTNVIGHVIVDSLGSSIDVIDRAGRLVGVVYGSQGQQLRQTATNFNLQVELATGGTLYDARQVRTLTSADVVTIGPNGGPLPVNLEVSGTPLGITFYGSPVATALNVWVANMDVPLRFPGSVTLTTTAVNALLPGVASIFQDLTYLQASNTSATGVRVDISDGTKTYSWFLAPSGGGFNLNFDPPLAATNPGIGWTAAISANVSDVRVSAQAVKR